jgi:hypothetical protein
MGRFNPPNVFRWRAQPLRTEYDAYQSRAQRGGLGAYKQGKLDRVK